ncbi:DEKNAAC101425 [Brettanomyces naardenensis]|uniref:DEKNAAC101425 n=1 Tax=Brettanomyces naardenensis TaxID=13370 RepID=A0A448YI35_BRENA|nr:DEKNAAC101425 [Brettanomyces naardenensis]
MNISDYGNFSDPSLECTPFSFQLLELEKASILQAKLKRERELYPQRFTRQANSFQRSKYQRNKYNGTGGSGNGQIFTSYDQNYTSYGTQYQRPNYTNYPSNYTNYQTNYGVQGFQQQQLPNTTTAQATQGFSQPTSSLEEPTPFQRQLQSILRAATPVGSGNSGAGGNITALPQPQIPGTGGSINALPQPPIPAVSSNSPTSVSSTSIDSKQTINNPPSFSPSLFRAPSAPGGLYMNNSAASSLDSLGFTQQQKPQRSSSSLSVTASNSSGSIWGSTNQPLNYNGESSVLNGSINNFFSNVSSQPGNVSAGNKLTWSAGLY